MRISIIGGTGNQGKGLALRLGKAGYQILLGSRSKERAEDIANELKEKNPDIIIEGLGNIEAANKGDLIILTIPYTSIDKTVLELREAVKGKVVVDTSVALVPGKPPSTKRVPEGSVAQKINNIIGDEAKVVSAFHTISAHLLQELNKEISGDTLIAGDDQEAKEIVSIMAEKIGLRPLDAGPLRVSSILEELTSLLIGMNIRFKKKSIGVTFTNI
ncbi:NADPH-dependent F420 reductase [Paenibacillus sp. BSR1-1]|uniref:NADPH-dependent F420 reductase n=1 Tax=Paenibacillus sp. BSR1-1 TaxID=3020845 RepID=UPI0025B1F947|nr:NADPH-dependent F420 reductase [Paenibacillus sp. BSR1-1]MDN3016187.1 NADPH-dependent F420 reductase [Paenibacillus sp. BSR1-1]